MDKNLINESKQLLDKHSLEIEEQEILNEISIGKLTTTVFLGRIKLLTRKIKDINLRKTFMTLGYMIYTVSLQSKSLEKIESNLEKITQQLNKQETDIQKLNNKK